MLKIVGLGRCTTEMLEDSLELKKFLLNKIKTESYSKILIDNNHIKSNDIFKMKMSLDLNIAYAQS